MSNSRAVGDDSPPPSDAAAVEGTPEVVVVEADTEGHAVGRASRRCKIYSVARLISRCMSKL